MFAQFRRQAVLVSIVLMIIPMVAAPIARAQSEQIEANKETAARIITAFSHQAQLEEVEAMIAADFTVHYPTGDLGWEAVKGSLLAFQAAMPDLTFTPLIMVAEGNQVAVRYELTATFANPLESFDGTAIPPTGEPVRLQSNAVFTFNDNGQLVEFAEIFDNMAFMTQLGVFPPSPVVADVPQPDPAVWELTETDAAFTDALRSTVSSMVTALNDGDADALRSLAASDYIMYPPAVDRDMAAANFLAMRAAIPDMQVTATRIIAEGNWVAYGWELTGTFSGRLQMGDVDVPPTNQPILVEALSLAYANEEGLIAAEWSEIDNLALFTQLGLFAAQ